LIMGAACCVYKGETMFGWTKSGYWIWPFRDGRGVKIKKGGKRLYTIMISGDDSCYKHRVVPATGSLPTSETGWDYYKETRQCTLVGQPTVPQEVIETINNNYHPRPYKRTWVDTVMEWLDAIATLFRHV
jgi:hypothetical protein